MLRPEYNIEIDVEVVDGNLNRFSYWIHFANAIKNNIYRGLQEKEESLCYS